MRQIQTLSATTSAIDWDVYLADRFDVPRIDLVFASAPTSAGLITITKDAGAGAAYDQGIRTVNPVGLTEVSIEGLHGFSDGDKINVSYANPDSVSISASATVEVPILSALHIDDMTISDGHIRSARSDYRHHHSINMFSSDPGSSGATFETSTSNYIGGMRLNASTDVLQTEFRILNNWDSSIDPELSVHLTTMMDNTGGSPTDIIKFKTVLYYSQPGVPGIRTQTYYPQGVVGQLPLYSQLTFSKTMDRNATDNPILPGDSMYAEVNLEADSDIDDLIINTAVFYYNTTHVCVEDGDI